MITPIRRGEYVDVFNVVHGRMERVMVLSPCGHVAVGYFCDSCDVHCATLAALVEHLAIEEPHRVAVWCSTHGYYTEADAAQLTALDPHPTSNL